MEQKKKIKVIIIVLACLLGLSLLALGGTLIYNKIANTTPATVTVPDNLITPDEDTTKPDSGDSQAPDSSETQTPDGSADTSSSAVPTQSTTAETKKAATIELYNKQPEETQRLPWAICSRATAKQNTSVCGYPITIKSPCITKPPSAPVMRN